MPRLPTMRVTGSQDISLTVTFWSCGASVAAMFPPLPALGVTGRELGAVVPPLGFVVELALDGLLAAPAQDRAVAELREVRRELAVGVLVHEGHVLVGEARHRARHADPADVGTAAHVALPAAQRHVALDHRALAAELDQAAVVGAVLGGEVALLVERRAVAALVRGAPEERDGPARVVELGHGAHAGQREDEVHER